MFLTPGWHPIVVHFPLALIVTAAVALSLARWVPGNRMSATLASVGTFNLCVGAAMLFLALGTGLAASIGLEIAADAHRAIASHVKAAVLTTILTLLAAVLRGAGAAADSRPTPALLVIVWLATAATTVTGYRGGQNVYRYGIGVDVATPRGAP